jgi:hypothetical protein
MSRIDLYRSSMVPVEYDTLTGELIPKEDVIIEERPVRMLSDMWRLFKLGNESLENRALYYMNNEYDHVPYSILLQLYLEAA